LIKKVAKKSQTSRLIDSQSYTSIENYIKTVKDKEREGKKNSLANIKERK
jgi:hypothetical protein